MLLALFPVAFLAAASTPPTTPPPATPPTENAGIWIITKTALPSANWIWSEEPVQQMWDEFEERRLLNKKRFSEDSKRTKIGIGEKIRLRIKEKQGSDAAGEESRIKWTIVEGGEWAAFVDTDAGWEVALGAKVLDGPESRKVKVRVTAGTTPELMAEKEITVVKPSGVLKSRHAGPPPGKNIHVPILEQYPHGFIPANETGAATKLVIIPMPSDVNFGGDFDGGVHVIEKDIESPPKPRTFTLETGSVFASNTHHPNLSCVKIDAISAAWQDWIWTKHPTPSF